VFHDLPLRQEMGGGGGGLDKKEAVIDMATEMLEVRWLTDGKRVFTFLGVSCVLIPTRSGKQNKRKKGSRGRDCGTRMKENKKQEKDPDKTQC
jgi:hypothetical protein